MEPVKGEDGTDLATNRVASHLLGSRLVHVDVLTMHIFPEVEPASM